MSGLYFQIGADFDKLKQLKREIDDLKSTLLGMDKSADPQTFEALNKRLQQLQSEFNKSAESAARFGATYENNLRNKIQESSVTVNELTRKIIEQKSIIKDIEHDVNKLGQAYRKLSNSDPGKKDALNEWNAAKKALAEEKSSLFALQQRQSEARLTTRELREEYSRYTGNIRDSSKATDNASDSLLNYIKKGAALAGVTFGIDKIKDLGSEIISVHNQFQQLEIAFGTMLKSKDKAASLMKDLTQFAAETPFGLQSAASGAKQLLAYGSTADTVIRELTMLGDVAAGTGQQIGDLVYLYGTLRTQGRAYLMDIRQFAGRGIPIYDELAKVLNTSKDKVNDFVSAGKVGFKEVEQAFKNMTSQGGLYGGLMEQQSASIGGRIEALKDNIDSIFNTIGKDSEGIIYKSIDGLNSLVDNYEEVGEVILSLVATYGVYKTAVIALNVVQRIQGEIALQNALAGRTLTTWQGLQAVVTRQVTVATAALNKTMLANPYVAVGVAVAALSYGLYKLYTHQTEAEKAQSRLNETTKEYESNIESEKVKLDILFGKLKSAKEGTDKYKEAKQAILNMADSYHLSISKDIDLVKEETKYRNILNAAIIETAKAKAIESGTQKATEIYTKQWGEGISEIRDRFIKKFGESQGELLLDSLKESLSSGTELTKEVKSAIGRFSEVYYGSSVTGGGSTTLNPVQQLVNNIQISKKTLDKEVKDLEGVFGKLRKTEDVDNKVVDPFKTYSEQIDDARKKVSDLKTEFNNLQKGIKPKSLKQGEQFDFAQGIENKAKELKEAEDKLSFLLTGQSSSANLKAGNQAESAAEKAIKQAQGIADQQEKIADIKLKQTLESKRKQEDLENQLTQSYINNLAEGSEKIRYQRELDNYLEIQSLERAKEDYIQAYIQAEREKFDAAEDLKLKQNSKYLKKKFDSSSITVDTSSYDTIINNTRNNQAFVQMEAEKKAWNEHLIQFGTYQEKRKAIIEKYEKEIDQALTKGDAATLEKQKRNQLDELDNSVRNSTTLMGQLFADASRKSVNEMQAIIEKADLLLQYLEAVKDEQSNATIGGKNVSKNDILGLGITENTLNNLSQSTQEVESLRNAIKQLKGELGEKSAFKLFEIQIKDAINLINGGKLSQGISGIGSAVSQFSPAVSQFGQDLGNILGNDDLGNKISGIADAIGGLGQTAQGVGQIMSGDIIGGTMAVVSGISKVVDALDGLFGADYSKFNAMKEQYDSLNEVWDQLIDKKKEYLAMAYGEEAKRVGKEAEDLVNKSIESYRLLGKEYLNSGTSAGSHSKGVRQRERINSEGWAELQQWAKNNDISESLYGSVAGGRMTGLFDLTAAQLEKLKEDAPTFWAKLSDETKEYLDNIIDGAAKIEDINKSIKEQLTQVSFDSVFDDFIDTLMDMDSSSKDFADNFANYLQKAILSSLVADKYREKLQAWYDNFAKANEEDGIDAKEYADLQAEYNKIVEDALKERDALKDLLNWTGSDSSSQSPSKGGYETMSQDTATALEGRFTAIQMSTLNIEGYVKRIAEKDTIFNSIMDSPIKQSPELTSMLTQTMTISETVKAQLANLDEIRTIQLNSYYELKDINKNTQELYPIRQEISSMNRKLDNI